jgi:hypothetical protein
MNEVGKNSMEYEDRKRFSKYEIYFRVKLILLFFNLLLKKMNNSIVKQSYLTKEKRKKNVLSTELRK